MCRPDDKAEATSRAGHDISRAGGVFKYFLDHKVAFTDGAAFADPSAVRLNFGTQRALVDEGLECAIRAVTALQK